jgi:hypothetical protein
VYVPPPVPRCSAWASSSLISPSRISLPRNCSRVGLHIDLFEARSAFTRVAARTLARSPIRDPLYRRLQPFRHLHDCSGCFRLERLPGGACTHWKTPPSHGARKKRTLRAARPDVLSHGRGARPAARLAVRPQGVRPAKKGPARGIDPYCNATREACRVSAQLQAWLRRRASGDTRRRQPVQRSRDPS